MPLSEADIAQLRSRLNLVQETFRVITPTDFRATVGSPTLSTPGASPDQMLAWLMDGAGADEEIGGVLIRVPEDISPDDDTLDFEVLCGMSVAGAGGEDVVLDVGLATISDGDDLDEARTLVGAITTDVSAKGAAEFFTVTFSPATNYSGGDNIRVSVRRNSGDVADDFGSDIYIHGVACLYWHKALQEFAE